MAVSGQPSSRKGKKSWRRNVDVSQEIGALHERSERERLGISDLPTAANESLFALDRESSQKKGKKAISKNKSVKTILNSLKPGPEPLFSRPQKDAVGVSKSKSQPKAGTLSSLTPNAKQQKKTYKNDDFVVQRKVKAIIAAKALKTSVNDDDFPCGAAKKYDLWGDDSPAAAQKSKQVAPGTRAPLAKRMLPAVRPADAGCSYNPDPKQQKDFISATMNTIRHEQAKAKREERLRNQLMPCKPKTGIMGRDFIVDNISDFDVNVKNVDKKSTKRSSNSLDEGLVNNNSDTDASDADFKILSTSNSTDELSSKSEATSTQEELTSSSSAAVAVAVDTDSTTDSRDNLAEADADSIDDENDDITLASTEENNIIEDLSIEDSKTDAHSERKILKKNNKSKKLARRRTELKKLSRDPENAAMVLSAIKLQAEIRERLLKKRKETRKKKQLRPLKLGQTTFRPVLDPKVVESASNPVSSLREIVQAGNLFRDRFESFMGRNMLEARSRTTAKRRYPQLYYQKRSYKDFEQGIL